MAAHLSSVQSGATVLAQRRGEVRPEMVENLAVLGLATFPLPAPVLRLLDIDPDHWLEQGVLRVEGDGYVLADNWLRQRAQGLISNRMAVEDALADALTRANVGEGRWENIARHRIQGRDPNRALPYAIERLFRLRRAASPMQGWLMAIDPLKRDRDAPPTRHSASTAWACGTSLRTELSAFGTIWWPSTRSSHHHRRQAPVRHHRGGHDARQGRHDDAVALLERIWWTTPPYPWRALKAARVRRPRPTQRKAPQERVPRCPPTARWSVSSACWRPCGYPGGLQASDRSRGVESSRALPRRHSAEAWVGSARHW